MNRTMTAYLLTETAISIVINVAISIGFVFAVFHGMAAVPTSGPGGLIRDAVPQTFAISLMSVLVPTLITRSRGHSRILPAPRFPRSFQPGHVLLRAFLIALVAAACGVTINYALFNHAPNALAFLSVLAFKACYGGLVALTVTPIAVFLALHDVAVQPVSDGLTTRNSEQ